MKRILFVLSLITLVSFGFCCTLNYNAIKQTTQDQNMQQDYDLYKTVARLYVNMALIPARGVSATGYAIDKEYMLTASHFCVFVLINQMNGLLENNVRMEYLDGQTMYVKENLKIIKLDSERDLCLIKKKGHGLKPVVFFDNYDNLKIGDIVQVLGAPLGVSFVLTEGRIISKDMTCNLGKYVNLFYSADVFAGNSGGPIFYRGRLIGSVVGGSMDYPKVNVGTDINRIKEFLKSK